MCLSFASILRRLICTESVIQLSYIPNILSHTLSVICYSCSVKTFNSGIELNWNAEKSDHRYSPSFEKGGFRRKIDSSFLSKTQFLAILQFHTTLSEHWDDPSFRSLLFDCSSNHSSTKSTLLEFFGGETLQDLKISEFQPRLLWTCNEV